MFYKFKPNYRTRNIGKIIYTYIENSEDIKYNKKYVCFVCSADEKT